MVPQGGGSRKCLGTCKLGDCYANGSGVAKDQAEALKWYHKAADQGYEKAKKALLDMGK